MALPNLRLFGGRVLVQLVRDEDIAQLLGNSTVLVVPNKGYALAKVLLVGPGVRKGTAVVPVDVAPGDRVVIAPQWVKTKQAWILGEVFGDHDTVIIQAEDILCVIDE